MQMQTQEVLSWFGPRDVHPIPKQPAWTFSYPNFIHHKSTPSTPLDKTTFIKSIQLFSTPRRKFPCTPLLNTKKITLYNSSLWVITINPISLKTCKWSWKRTLIGGLSEFFTIRLELCEEMKVKTSFLENRIFQQSLNRKLIIWIDVKHPRTTILFIAEINSQLGKLSSQIWISEGWINTRIIITV